MAFAGPGLTFVGFWFWEMQTLRAFISPSGLYARGTWFLSLYRNCNYFLNLRYVSIIPFSLSKSEMSLCPNFNTSTSIYWRNFQIYCFKWNCLLNGITRNSVLGSMTQPYSLWPLIGLVQERNFWIYERKHTGLVLESRVHKACRYNWVMADVIYTFSLSRVRLVCSVLLSSLYCGCWIWYRTLRYTYNTPHMEHCDFKCCIKPILKVWTLILFLGSRENFYCVLREMCKIWIYL
jgi:hypothetical protein